MPRALLGRRCPLHTEAAPVFCGVRVPTSNQGTPGALLDSLAKCVGAMVGQHEAESTEVWFARLYPICR